MAERYNAAVAFVDRHLTEGRAEKVAFRDPRRALTYGELHDQASRVGPALEALGIAPEHRVVMLMLDTVDFPVLFRGANRAGIIPVPRFGPQPPTKDATGAIEAMALYAGQSAGAVVRRQPAREVVADLAAGL